MKEVKASDYSIFIGQESLQAYDFNSYKQLAILVDENTKRDCLPIFLKATNIDAILIEIPSGEEHKNLEKCQLIWNLLSSYHFDRNSLLINLGGGVVGDMGGFAASTYKRGIDFIQIPTSLLAMVDASIGGKLGVDFAYLKNQIGLFNNPKAVLINPVFLNSLPKNQLLSGFADNILLKLVVNVKSFPFLYTHSGFAPKWSLTKCTSFSFGLYQTIDPCQLLCTKNSNP